MIKALYILPILVLSVTAHAAEIIPSLNSKYLGQEIRNIKSLSPDDINELRRGGGWGLAKAAELNGVPGPSHLLDMRDEIRLSPEQYFEVDEIYTKMKEAAIQQGELLITLEQELELLFKSGTITQSSLHTTLSKIEKVRMELRFTHLATHLKTRSILSEDQITKYSKIRGYSNQVPCDKIPLGHGAEMSRKHNGCS